MNLFVFLFEYIKYIIRQRGNLNVGWILDDIKDLLFRCDNSVVMFLKKSSFIWGAHRFFMGEMIWHGNCFKRMTWLSEIKL